MTQPIYHITSVEAWDADNGSSSFVAPSLATEGFIHCSDARQVERSLNRFFREKDEVVLLRIDPALLTSELRYEGADGDSFPHIYGPINTDAVVTAELIHRHGEQWEYTPAG